MREVTKVVFMSDDDREFDSKKACMDYEAKQAFDSVMESAFYNEDDDACAIWNYEDLTRFVSYSEGRRVLKHLLSEYERQSDSNT